jgi:hypothetical protein
VLTFGVTSGLDVTDLDVLVDGIEAGWWSLAGRAESAETAATSADSRL